MCESKKQLHCSFVHSLSAFKHKLIHKLIHAITAGILFSFRGDPRVCTTFSSYPTPTSPSTITSWPTCPCTDDVPPCTTQCVFGSSYLECKQIQQRPGRSRPSCCPGNETSVVPRPLLLFADEREVQARSWKLSS